jgi:biopolymer transport protein ExbB/TolQ
MLLIGVIFLLTLFLIIERFIALSKLGVDKSSVVSNVRGMLLRGDIRQAITFCDKSPAPLTNTIQVGLVQVLNRRPDEEVQVAMDASVLRETPRLEGWVSFLAVFGNVAVLVGLLGTIIGMIKSFGGVAEADQAEKAQILAEGISEALNCTAFGLFVAIIAIVSYGFFQIKISRTTNDMLETSMDVMNLVTANRDKIQRT